MVEQIDRDVMIGSFIARWDDAADGVMMDADTAQALAHEFKRMARLIALLREPDAAMVVDATVAVSLAIVGSDFDPFANPEAYEHHSQIATAALAAAADHMEAGDAG